MGQKAYEFHPVGKVDNRDKEGVWILDGGRMGLALKWKCPFCFDRDSKPKPFCHGCGAKLVKGKNYEIQL